MPIRFRLPTKSMCYAYYRSTNLDMPETAFRRLFDETWTYYQKHKDARRFEFELTRRKNPVGNPMKLLTKEILSKLPRLYSQENVKDPIVQIKFFTPWTNWTWYGIEFDGKDTFFGLVIGHDEELGYFSLRELQSIRGLGGLGIERDLHFRPMLLSQVRAKHPNPLAKVRPTVSKIPTFSGIITAIRKVR